MTGMRAFASVASSYSLHAREVLRYLRVGVGAAARSREAGQADEFRQLSKVEPLPVALDRDFEFRKTKFFWLGELPGPRAGRISLATSTVDRPAIRAESAYRLFGAVTELDQRRRYGNYFDFFWRAKTARRRSLFDWNIARKNCAPHPGAGSVLPECAREAIRPRSR